MIRQNSKLNEKTFLKIKMCPEMSKYLEWGEIIWGMLVGFFVYVFFWFVGLWGLFVFHFHDSRNLKGVIPRSHLWQTRHISFLQNIVPCWILTAPLICRKKHFGELPIGSQKHGRCNNFASPEVESNIMRKNLGRWGIT